MHNEEHRAYMCDTFGSLDEIYGRLSNWLFHPIDLLQKVIDDVKLRFGGYHVLGLQIRYVNRPTPSFFSPILLLVLIT